MELLAQIGNMPWADWLAILLPYLLLFGLVYWRRRNIEHSGGKFATWSGNQGWRAKTAYLGRLVGFGLLSFLTLAASLIIYQNVRMVRAYTAPAGHQVDRPDEFPHPLHPVAFQSEGDRTFRGWLINPLKPATVILLHGYGSDRRAMLWKADQLAAAGLGILLYDQRASGMSEGDQRSYGWKDPVDVSASLDFLATNPTTADGSYGAAGCSIGGQIALQAAAHDQRIEAVWADGPAVVRAADLPTPYNWVTVISSLSSQVTDWTFAAQLGMLPPSALVDQLPAISPRPVQLVAGGMGVNAMGPESRLSEHLMQHSGPGTDLWVIQAAVHCDGPVVAPDTYSDRLVDSFNRALTE